MKVTIAATQMACSSDMEKFDTAERLVRNAAKQSANVILLQEMFATHFFAFMDWKAEYFKFALWQNQLYSVELFSRASARLVLIR
jgi:N-carbamoylputrescine amidase